MIKTEIHKWRPGILSRRQLKILEDSGILCGVTKIKNAAVDLHLSSTGWKLKGTIKLRNSEGFDGVLSRKEFIEGPLNLESETILEPGHTYVILLKESLKAKDTGTCLYGRATGKSSIGRLDILTRLISNGCEQYDTIDKEYSGSLYVEVTPITFPIVVREGVSLNQIRLFRGHPDLSTLESDEIGLYGDMIGDGPHQAQLTLSVEPTTINSQKAIAFTTLKTDKFSPINLCNGDETVDPKLYWQIVPQTDEGDFIRIQAESFYILRSHERFKLPCDVAVYCPAITESLGEIRIHFAGFVHPGFGCDRPDDDGAPLIFEVRGYTVNALLRQGELMTHLKYYRTSEKVEPEKSPYDEQELKLSKYFDMSKWET